MKAISIALTTSVLVLSSNANAALIERLGGLAYYDDEANLTWLADANYAVTSGYAAANANADALGFDINDIYADGKMGWKAANNWVTGLTVGGVSGWRLADTMQPDASCDTQRSGVSNGFNCTGSEMGNLFYNALGNSARSLSNAGSFSNIQSYYWSFTEYEKNASSAWRFSMSNGHQITSFKAYSMYVWAVKSGDVGDVSAVPVPAAMWLFGSGLIGLAGFARRKKV